MLLKFSLSSLSILITSVLNSASDRLFIYILFSSFSGVLICSFIWAMFLYLFILAASLCLFLCIRKSCYEVFPEGIQSCTMKNRDIYWRRYKIQETLYIGEWCLSPLQSRHLGTSHRCPNQHQLHHHIFLNLTDSLKSLPFQRWF